MSHRGLLERDEAAKSQATRNMASRATSSRMESDLDLDLGPVGMEDFPDKVLANIVAYLPKVARALFAVALTAPSASWERCGWKKESSRASKIVMSSPYYGPYLMLLIANLWNEDGVIQPGNAPTLEQRIVSKVYDEKWEDLVLLDEADEFLASKLTDGEVGAILVCINAKNNLKRLYLRNCGGISGNCLTPLREATRLNTVDLSLDEFDERQSDATTPMLSEDAVAPVLRSIVENSSLVYIEYPKLWLERRSEVLVNFLKEYNRAMNKRQLGCSNCDGLCIGTDTSPWILQEGQYFGGLNLTCFRCMEHYCSVCAGEGDMLRYCSSCEKNLCSACARITTCCECNMPKCRRCSTFSTCTNCRGIICGDCSSFENCAPCQQKLCGRCVEYIRCSACESDHASNCMDCAVTRRGSVKLCTHCRRGFCSGCKVLDYCFMLSSDVCPECHEKLHDVIKCNWQPFPHELKQIVADLAEEDVMLASRFWMRCGEFLVHDKCYDMKQYHSDQHAIASSCIIAADFLLKERDKEAAYILFYAALVGEVLQRGPTFMGLYFEDEHESTGDCTYFYQFRRAIVHTQSRKSIVEHIRGEMARLNFGGNRL